MTIRNIQKKMTTDALLVFRNNQFLGQDLLEEENQILALTNFSGSAGKLIITPERAFLFVDGRYEIQAKQQTNSKDVSVIVEDNVQNFNTWMKTNLFNADITYNPWQISESALQKMKRSLPNAKWISKAELMPIKRAKVFEHPLEYAGEEVSDKISRLAAKMNDDGTDATLVSAADSVSWLLNIRSNALPDTPIVRAMALVSAKKQVIVLADNLVLPRQCKLEKHAFKEIKNVLRNFKNQKVSMDFDKTPAAIIDICKELNIKITNRADFCAIAKAEKNQVELKGMINAHIRDGIAVCKFLSWFDGNYRNKNELDMVEKLLAFRKRQPLFHSVSFDTIAGSAANAAIIHYQPTKKTHSKIKNNSVLLLDSGGQYFDGTTDITRTIAVGSPTKDMIEKFTIVLKAHIALASQKFPVHTSGTRLDAICRSVMWRYGLDYKHGTGHGVGCFLNVHEGPQNLSVSGNNYAVVPNMVISIEPGYYEEGNFGVRIENLVYVTESSLTGFLNFVPLTLVPIDYRLIDKYLLNEREINWLNSYHNNVYKLIAPYLGAKEQEWLQKACSPL